MNLDHGTLNVPLAKRGDIDAQLDKHKADQAAQAKRLAKARAQETIALRKRAKAIVEAMTVERLSELANKFNTTPANVRNLMRSNAFWNPAVVIETEDGKQSAQHTLAREVLVQAAVSDKLVHQLTGMDPAYYDATGNKADAAVVRERAQRMWDALIDIAKAQGSAP